MTLDDALVFFRSAIKRLSETLADLEAEPNRPDEEEDA
jgi:hypothetical protein